MIDSPMLRLEALRQLSSADRKKRLNELNSDCPLKPWPYGMPGSADPWVVLIGVSPGRANHGQHGHRRTGETPTFGSPPQGFLYTGSYWGRCCDLAKYVVRRDAPKIPEDDALAMAAHFNLGTGNAGLASTSAIESDIQCWVRTVLASSLRPKIIVCFGLLGILGKPPFCDVWGKGPGLTVDWKRATHMEAFGSYPYSFRLWIVKTGGGRETALIAWPNHPSRHPFAGGPKDRPWTDAKAQLDRILKDYGF